MLVFPDELKRIDPEDINNSIRDIENELAYIRERADYAIRALMERVDKVEKKLEGGD